MGGLLRARPLGPGHGAVGSLKPTGRLAARTDRYQQWQALIDNRKTRQRLGLFLVQGVQPITTAVAAGWPLEAILYRPGPRSGWAEQILAGPAPGERVELAPDLLAELGGRQDGPPELVVVARTPSDDLERLGAGADLVVVGDRTSSPGNIGTVVRSADALGAAGVVLTGHAADPYDPQAVRASRGSLFASPVVRAASPAEVVAWAASLARPLTIVGTSEEATTTLWDHDWRLPSLVVVGNETSGMSRAWAEACDVTVAIPQGGAATSLNAAVSASIVLYEAVRQRGGR